MADILFNGVLFRSDPSLEPRLYFINARAARELLGTAPPGSFARHLARQRHYERLLRPKYKRGHRKLKEAKRG